MSIDTDEQPDLAERVTRLEDEVAQLREDRQRLVTEAQGFAIGVLHADLQAVRGDVAVIREQMATKGDLAALAAELRGELASKADLTELRAEVHGDLIDLRAEIHGDLASMRIALAEMLTRLPPAGPTTAP